MAKEVLKIGDVEISKDTNKTDGYLLTKGGGQPVKITEKQLEKCLENALKFFIKSKLK